MAKILIVEDEYITAKNLSSSLDGMGHHVVGIAGSGEEAIALAEKEHPDIALMDIKLKGKMDGIEASQQLKDRFDIPSIYSTAYADAATLERAKITEPFGYILKPFSDDDVRSNIEIALYKHQADMKLRSILNGVIEALGNLVKMHDPFIDKQQERASTLAKAIATEIGLPYQETEGIRIAALLHALGLISMPFDLLNHRFDLSDAALKIFHTYPERGYDILKNIEFPWPVATVVLQHQERLDGSGFPGGLSGDEIIPEARIVGLACHVAMRFTGCCTTRAIGIEEILHELKQENGKLFEPAATEACIRLFEENRLSL